MNGWLTIGLLVISNIFMTFAWYGHLKLQQMKIITSNTPLYVVILISWVIALAEYSCQVPANRMGYIGNGGAFSLMQLKVIQEAITLIGVHPVHGGVFQRRVASLESFRGICVPHPRRLFCIHEVEL